MGLVVDSYRIAAATSFAPTDIAGCIAWWDASDTATITASGGAVSQWDDKSTAGRDATQSTAGLKPTTGAATQNSLNVITFNNDQLNFTAITSDDVARSCFVVGKKDAVANATAAFASTADNAVYFVFTGDATTGSVQVRRASATASSAASLANGTYGILSFTDTGGTTSSTRVGLNGTYSAAVAGGATSGGWDVIGAYPSSATFSLTGAIAEIIVYDTVLSAGDITTVNDYLTDKWGL